MRLAEIMLLALALSFDCLGVGLSYGLKQMILPWYGVIIICGCSGMVLALSMFLGRWAGGYLPAEWMPVPGALLLTGLGLFMLSRSFKELVEEDDGEAPLFQIEIARFGIVVQILKEPHHADLDHSGRINTREAVWLGFALSMDSCGAGIGMAMLGYSPVITSLCTAAGGCICLWLGLSIGQHAGEASVWQSRRWKLLPGIILTLVGFIKLLV